MPALMDGSEFLGLAPTHNPHRWTLPVRPAIATGHGFLFGGCGLAAAAEALQRTCGRPLVWATAQYLAFAMVDEIVDLDVTIATEGRHTTQARVIAHVADKEIFTVNAALGERPVPREGDYAPRPDAPPPGDCEKRADRWDVGETIGHHTEARLITARQWTDLPGNPAPGGKVSVWLRMPEVSMSVTPLAIFGDYVPYGINQALGAWIFANSLDNTIRIARLVPTEWVLAEISIYAVHNGFGHGHVHLWAEDGTFLASASQSAIVREAR